MGKGSEVLVTPSPSACMSPPPGEAPTNVIELFRYAPHKLREYPEVINGITVYGTGGGWYDVPSLGIAVAVQGPLGGRVLKTLTRSPRVGVAVTCAPSGNANEAIVDLESHRSFGRLRTVCVGRLQGTGVIEAGALFLIHDVSPTEYDNTEIVRIDLNTYATVSIPVAGAVHIFAGLGDIWAVTESSLVQLSSSSLRVVHRYGDPSGAGDFLPFGGLLWFIDNYSLKTLNPADGRVSTADLPWLPTGLSPASLTSSSDQLYLLAASQKTPETAIVTYNPVSGAHRTVAESDLGGGANLVGVTGKVLWVQPPGGNMHQVTAYSTQTLKPLTDGFSDGGPNGMWTAVTASGDLWFQLSGYPLECVSGKTGRLDATLRLPNTFSQQNIAGATPPGFVAADANHLFVAATETHGATYSESSVAVYALDPRCRG